MFEAFYASSVQAPGLLWLAAAVALGVVLTREGLAPSMRRYCIGLVVLTMLDAWLTANHVFGFGSLPASLSSVVPLFFVLAGDFRYWLVVTAADADGELRAGRGSIARAVGLTLIVPLLTQVASALAPDAFTNPRVTYLVYELAFVALTLVAMATSPRIARAAWLRRVSRFVVLYYTLWATADIVILATGSDLGFALRVVPNVLYYGGLIAMIAASAPRRAGQE
jgi:hypothetical protein